MRFFSHDENTHVFYSWLYATGKGYQYNPVSHGPLQFHLLALTYQFLGASDFTARLPHALASILTIVLLWKWRRYLGRAGHWWRLGFNVISPVLALLWALCPQLRAFIGVIFVLMLYAILRYLETGKARYLVLLTLATILHFTAKESAFYLHSPGDAFWQLLNPSCYPRSLEESSYSVRFRYFLVDRCIGGVRCTGTDKTISVCTYAHYHCRYHCLSGIPCGRYPFDRWLWLGEPAPRTFIRYVNPAQHICHPAIGRVPVTALGWNPLDYQYNWPGWNLSALWAQQPVRTALVFFVLCIISVAIGLLWDRKRWIIYAARSGVFTSSFLPAFLATGKAFSLVRLARSVIGCNNKACTVEATMGLLPAIEIPIYEFLPALGLWLAVYFGLHRISLADPTTDFAKNSATGNSADVSGIPPVAPTKEPVPSEGNYTFQLLIWWALTSLLAFTLAGEKMPWLTVHITLPAMILLPAGRWDRLLKRVNWSSSASSAAELSPFCW